MHLYMFPDSSSSDPTEQTEPVGDLPQGELWSADVGGAVPRPYVWERVQHKQPGQVWASLSQSVSLLTKIMLLQIKGLAMVATCTVLRVCQCRDTEYTT